MSEQVSRHPRFQWRWIAAIALVVLINVLSFGMQSGQCIDYSAESGAESVCTSGPAIGMAGAWAVGVLSVLAVAYFVYRFARSSRAR